MEQKARIFIASVLLVCLFASQALASYGSFEFADDRFQGEFTTENLDRIIDEYELYDGWFWTTQAWKPQTFHGLENAPGWTDSTVNKNGKRGYKHGIYGCRWLANLIRPDVKGSILSGRGECFGFAQFIGYLLSGEYNLYKNWNYFYNLDASEGLRVGDVLRTEFEANGKKYAHSAVVYAVSDDEILFLQVAGGSYNRISVGAGFAYGYREPATTMEDLRKVPYLKIHRSQLNSPGQE